MMTKANTKYKTEKRKANVGERILITNAGYSGDTYSNGDVLTVTKDRGEDGVDIKEHPTAPFIETSEYEVIIEESQSTNERISALETQVAELQAEMQALKKRKKPRYVLTDLLSNYPKPNEQRKAVIERAKAFIEESKRKVSGIVNNGLPAEGTRLEISDVYSPRHNGIRTACNAEFIVNVDKRTVVVLLKGIITGKLYAKAIAKCAPDDVFNADIGKAIALGRALGLDVSEFENAPKPTEVVVGMVVSSVRGETRKVASVTNAHMNYTTGKCNSKSLIEDGRIVITDDTEAQY